MILLIGSTLLVGVITILTLVHFITGRNIAGIVKHFPTPPCLPILGNLLVFWGKSPPEIFKTMIGFHSEYGANLLTFGIFNFVTLNITDPKDVEKVMVSKATQAKASTYNYFRGWLGNGLLVSSGKDWFVQRKIITPAFHFNILDDFISVFNKQTDQMIEILKKHADEGMVFNIYDNVTLCALDIICESAMGVDIEAQKYPDQEYIRAVKRMSAYIFDRFFMALSQYDSVFNLTSTARKQKKELQILHDFTTNVIVTRKQQLEENPSLTPAYNAEGEKKKLTFLDLLLSSSLDGRPMTNQEIREQVDTFMFEGHDTTTSAISFAIYHLSQHPDVQEKAYAELVSILGSKDRNVALTHSNLQDMKYLEMAIKETLRLHPSVPLIGRTLTEDTEIGGVMVPKGIDIGIQIFAIHRNPAVFSNPDHFDPERFCEGYELRKNPYEYIPFSAGPRNCIGQRFAMLEMKAALSKLLLNYKILPDKLGEEIEVKMDLVLRPVNGVSVKLEYRI